MGFVNMKLQDVHARSLETSAILSSYYMPNAILPLHVIRVLNAAGVKFMLVGAHGIGGWMDEPRATQDVDIVVATRHHKKALKALLEKFGHLEADDHDVVTRLRDRETHKVAIDVMKQNQQLYRVALKHTHTVTSGGEIYQIPSLEMALAMKFASMISLHRADIDKYQDAHDFGRMVISNPEIDLEKVAQLGELVYPGGGNEIAEKIRQVRAGEKLNL
jgi:hypothetical protein